MRRIALLCAVLCLCTTAAVAWGRSVSVRPAASHSSHKPHHKAKKHIDRQEILQEVVQSTRRRLRRAPATSNAATTATSADPVLFGNQRWSPAPTTTRPAWPRRSRSPGHISGTAHSIAVYLDSHSTARHRVRRPVRGQQRPVPARCWRAAVSASPKAGAWNALPISATTVSASKSYWIAVLGKGGTMYFRDRAQRPLRERELLRRPACRAMPSAWSSGAQWSTCPVSAYVFRHRPPPVCSARPGHSDDHDDRAPRPRAPAPPVALPPLPVAPLPFTAPQISGTATQGQTLDHGERHLVDSPTGYSLPVAGLRHRRRELHHDHRRDRSSYTLTAGDVGHTHPRRSSPPATRRVDARQLRPDRGRRRRSRRPGEHRGARDQRHRDRRARR